MSFSLLPRSRGCSEGSCRGAASRRRPAQGDRAPQSAVSFCLATAERAAPFGKEQGIEVGERGRERWAERGGDAR
eukprot:scaffold22823_cov29-Tisochrysis_lutea.AAC.1